MRIYDSSAGVGRLFQAVEGIERAWADVREHWQDENAAHFEEIHLRPLRAEITEVVVAIQHLADVMGQAGRECGPER